jgi:hypothetical protein
MKKILAVMLWCASTVFAGSSTNISLGSGLVTNAALWSLGVIPTNGAVDCLIDSGHTVTNNAGSAIGLSCDNLILRGMLRAPGTQITAVNGQLVLDGGTNYIYPGSFTFNNNKYNPPIVVTTNGGVMYPYRWRFLLADGVTNDLSCLNRVVINSSLVAVGSPGVIGFIGNSGSVVLLTNVTLVATNIFFPVGYTIGTIFAPAGTNVPDYHFENCALTVGGMHCTNENSRFVFVQCTNTIGRSVASGTLRLHDVLLSNTVLNVSIYHNSGSEILGSWVLQASQLNFITNNAFATSAINASSLTNCTMDSNSAMWINQGGYGTINYTFHLQAAGSAAIPRLIVTNSTSTGILYLNGATKIDELIIRNAISIPMYAYTCTFSNVVMQGGNLTGTSNLVYFTGGSTLTRTNSAWGATSSTLMFSNTTCNITNIYAANIASDCNFTNLTTRITTRLTGSGRPTLNVGGGTLNLGAASFLDGWASLYNARVTGSHLLVDGVATNAVGNFTLTSEQEGIGY